MRLAGIELTDSRWSERFTRFPLRHAYLDIFGMMPAQVRGATGEIRIPEEARVGDYELVVIGSPTWWIKTSVPIRSYLKSDAAGRVLKGKRFAAYVVCRRHWGLNLRAVRKLGAERGGKYVDGIHFSFAGGQVRSLLSLLSYFGKGEDRERYLGVKIPPTNLKPDDLGQAQGFATRLADGLVSDVRSASAVPGKAQTLQPKDHDRRERHVSDETIDRTRLPIQRPPFSGVANQTLGGSEPGWEQIGHVTPGTIGRKRQLGLAQTARCARSAPTSTSAVPLTA